MDSNPDAARDFWSWAIRVYAAPGVAENCLSLQDEHGQCVPLLLWAAWAASQGRRIEESAVIQGVELARQWSGEVISPLRALRRRLKSPVSSGDEATRLPLREKIKSTELDAERALMAALEGITPIARSENSLSKQMPTQFLLEAMLSVATAWSPVVPAEALAGLTERLTKA